MLYMHVNVYKYTYSHAGKHRKKPHGLANLFTTFFLKKSKKGGRKNIIHERNPGEGFRRELEIKSHCEDLPAKQDPHMAFLMKPIGGISPGINILFTPWLSRSGFSDFKVR